MYIIEVIPIAKGVGKEELSYYTGRQVSPGAVVSVPIRRQTVSGIVTTATTVRSRKTDIKASDFAIRKVEKLRAQSFLDSQLVEAAQDTARYFATSTGKVLHAVIPRAALEDLSAYQAPGQLSQRQGTHEKFLLQTHPEDRSANYKSLVREDFAKGRSVFFCLPTLEDINKVKTKLEKGIEKYTYVLHGHLSRKEIKRIWNELLREEHSVLVIGTPKFLALPRLDLGTVILERESAASYKLPQAPFLDMRVYAEYLTKRRGQRFVLGDTLLRTETLWRYGNLEFTEYMPLKYRSLTSAASSLIDMRQVQAGDSQGEFRVFSDQLLKLLDRTWHHNEQSFLFASRRGLAPVTVCGDCGTTVLCSECQTPVVLHEHKSDDQKNTFRCHKCGRWRSAHETCRECGGWRLKALGIGVEGVKAEIQRRYPDRQLFIIDKDHTRTPKQARTEIEKFYQAPGSVLLGTEMAEQYLREPVENIAVVSLDSLFSIPDFRINEKIINILTDLRSLAQKEFLVQSRNAAQPILQHGLSGNLIDFYREEIAIRKQFAYPPFTVLIKITRQGQEKTVERDMSWLRDQLGAENLSLYPASPPRVKGKFVVHALLQVPRESWIDPELLAFLRSLPPQFVIRVDPESIL